jgi:acyl-CoA reductase-like NAD-dependent aldehyde dehydrogenase
MDPLPTSRDEVIAAIQRLADRAPRTREELSALEMESVELALHIQKRTSLHDVPEHVWHFLSDADIRFKDPEYAQVQLVSLREVLKDWSTEPQL